MRRIVSIEIVGLKGSDRTVDLGPLNVVTGAVGSGKSELLDAVRFVALGYIPALGRSAGSTALAMRGPALSVKATLDNGGTIERSLTRKGASLRSDQQASWLPDGATPAEHHAAIVALFGASEGEIAQQLDLRTLLSCTASQRAAAIEALLDATGTAPAVLAARGRALTLLRLAGVKPEKVPTSTDAALALALANVVTIDEAIRPAAEAVAVEIEQRLTGGVGAAQAFAKDRKSAHNLECKDKIAARGELETTLAGLVSADAADRLQVERDGLVTTSARARLEIEAAELAADARAKAETTLCDAVVMRERASVAAETVPALRERIEAARAEHAAIVDPEPIGAPVHVKPAAAQLERVGALRAASMDAYNAALALDVPEAISVTAQEAAWEAAKLALRSANVSPWREVERIADDIEFGGVEFSTPAHGNIEAPWVEELRSLATEHGGNADVARQAMLAAEGELGAARALTKAWELERARVIRERDALESKARTLRDEAETINREVTAAAESANAAARADYVEAFSAHSRTLDLNRQRRATLAAEIATIEGALKMTGEALALAIAAVTAAEARLDGMSGAADMTVTREVLTHADTRIAVLDAQLGHLREQVALRAKVESMLDEINKATALLAAWTAAEWACETLRKEDVATRSRGIEGRINTFLAAAGRTETAFVRAGKGQCDFGLRRNGEDIAVEALSGGETCLFTAAMAAAAIGIRNPDLACLLIEAGELPTVSDDGNPDARALLRGLEAVAGDLSHVIVASCHGIVAPDGWTLIHVARTVAVGASA